MLVVIWIFSMIRWKVVHGFGCIGPGYDPKMNWEYFVYDPDPDLDLFKNGLPICLSGSIVFKQTSQIEGEYNYHYMDVKEEMQACPTSNQKHEAFDILHCCFSVTLYRFSVCVASQQFPKITSYMQSRYNMSYTILEKWHKLFLGKDTNCSATVCGMGTLYEPFWHSFYILLLLN